MEEELKIYKKFIDFLKENKIELSSCACCYGIGIKINDKDLQFENMFICSNEDIEENYNKLKGSD